ncbi:hypothetical protein DL93DRAFT_1311623 [Clavulina sp. PMI_390]|nr:hypothetical protein DL93DRAFT_1311623 [Clavulina sp. PMI_390]
MSTTDNAQSQLRYPCPVCGNTFTRPQHVVRHLRSHTGERPYKCKECGDAFARSDLLSRHVNKCHPDLANSGPPQNSKQPKRRACEHCAHTGSRCDSNSPCASCVEQGVPCSRMPKALSHHHHHHHPPQMPSIPPPLPGYSDSRLPSLNTTVPSSYGASHRRNPSETSISDWSSDSSRSRLPPYSQPMMYSGSSGYESSSSVDSMSHRGGNSGLSWVPSSSSISSNNSNNPLDQATMTPSQVRAMYGGSLPSGYSHPSQFPASSLPAPPASMSLPNPAALPSLSNLPGPTGLHHLDNNYADTSAYAPLVAGTYGNTGSGNKLPSSSSTIGYAQRAPPRSSASIVRPRDRSKPYPYSPPSPSSSASRTSVGHIGQQSASLTPAPAWKDYAGPQGASNAYNYDAIAADFSSQGAVVPSMGHAGYPTSDDGHSHSSGSPPNTAPSGGNASGRPSLPGLESFMTATFPPLNNVTLPSSAAMAAQSSSSSSNPPHSATSMSAPGMAYLYGRGGDRRSSIASSADSFGVYQSCLSIFFRCSYHTFVTRRAPAPIFSHWQPMDLPRQAMARSRPLLVLEQAMVV